MEYAKTYQRKKLILFVTVVLISFGILLGRVVYISIFQGEYYKKLALEQQQRERMVKAPRGEILDRNGVVLATNEPVCTISVIHNQIEDKEAVISLLEEELGISRNTLEQKVEKWSSIERIKSNVDLEIGNRILEKEVAGIKVDVDYKRIYPYNELASKVLGFTGADNQGILGLEVQYEDWLKGEDGTILTITDAKGKEVENLLETRVEAIPGKDLELTLDYNIQSYCMQAAKVCYEKKQAQSVSILAMNPQNGEVLAMVDYPEYNLNDPFAKEENLTEEELNQRWRNQCINDTYEPGSVFKIITTAIAFEEDLVSTEENFFCPGYITVEDRRIRCHKTNGHGSQTFAEGLKNSCNPVFIGLGLRIGVPTYYSYFEKFHLMEKTKIDLPGEAQTIMHKEENMKAVELATVAFGQSFQVTPIRLATTVSALINGGKMITPHLAKTEELQPEAKDEDVICSEETSETLRILLEQVVADGTGSNAAVEGFEIGGKTATSQTLPRSSNKYISSFLGFAPADNPTVLLLVVIRDPKGIYYGGTVAAPVAGEIFENILPYLAQ